ncbi:MAG: Ig domain-containing protein [Verrucomicrobiota bacterium]|nr:Ig domain-containing protein [Verrucomicrobiota bacterium]
MIPFTNKAAKVQINTAMAVLGLAGACSLHAQSTPGFWDFTPAADAFSSSAVLDLSSFNEDVAGQDGWVTSSGDSFIRGDGKKIRFWTITAGSQGSMPDCTQQAKFFAKRGVNLVRWHSSLYDNGAANIGDASTSGIASAQRMVKAMKDEGIYTKLSFFFVLGLRIQAKWNIDGYTQAWLTANPTKADRAPFGLVFFDATVKAAHRNWINKLLTTPNPYDGNKTLATDKAVAIIETQNEDNLFFWTWDPTQFPPEQQQKIDKAFGDWLKGKYGSISEAFSTWGTLSENILTSPTGFQRDDVANGRVAVASVQYMTRDSARVGGDGKRMADQIQFLAERQYNYHKEFKEYVQSLGYGGTFTGSNWSTADNRFLHDVELYTYTASGVTDVHSYYDGLQTNAAVFTQVSGNDGGLFISGVNNPRVTPFVFKQVEGHPSFLSETTWVQPNPYRAESAILCAVYGALQDNDGFTFFASGEKGWQNTDGSYRTAWPVAFPSIMGMFPAASLIYREGYIAEAPTVVREGRTLENLSNKDISIAPYYFYKGGSWDPARNAKTEFAYNSTTGIGKVDPLAALVGKVEIGFDTNDDFVSPVVASNIDNDARTVKSITGEVELNFGYPQGMIPAGSTTAVEGSGFLKFDAPRAQGATGWLKAAGIIDTTDVALRLSENFGSLVVVPLDGLPISQSTKLLVEAIGADMANGYVTTPKSYTQSGRTFAGFTVSSVGSLPWMVEEITGNVTLKFDPTGSRIQSIQNLDINGNLREANTTGRALSSGYRFDLPKNALYTVVNLAPVANLTPVITTKGFRNAKKYDSYAFNLEAVSGDEPLTFSATGLPKGLTIAENGVITGTPSRGGTYTVTVNVTDADGDSDSREVPFYVLPVNDAPACDTILTGAATTRWGDFGWINGINFFYDGYYPFVYLFDYEGWIYVFGCSGDGDTDDAGYFFYDFNKAQFGWTKSEYYPYYFPAAGGDAVKLGL